MKDGKRIQLIHGKTLWRTALALLCAVVCACAAGRAVARESAAEREAKLRAGFLYHLAKLVTWEKDRFTDDKAPIIVGFLGDAMPELPDYFESQAPSYKAQNRDMLVRRFKLPAPDADKAVIQKRIGEIQRCHILYVPRELERDIQKFPGLFNARGTLIVGETRGFAEKQGMIGLEIVKGRIVIFVNRGNLKRGQLAVSAQFLQHAIQVDSKSEGAGTGQKNSQERQKH